MSTLFLQVGQCGNAVGTEWWELAESEAASVPVSSFHLEAAGPGSGRDRAAGSSSKRLSQSRRQQHPLFDDRDGCARAVFVDSEPKVVSETCSRLKVGRWATVLPIF
jgi:hypothetical protein